MFSTFVSLMGVCAGGASATCWFWASILKPSYPMAYLDGPPQEIIERMDFQARLNALGAAAAGTTILCQAILMAQPLISN
jgi:hypothetical protein